MRLPATHRVMLEITLMLRILSLAYLSSVRRHRFALVQLSFSGVLLYQRVQKDVSIRSPLTWNEWFAFSMTVPSLQNINPYSLDKKHSINHF